MEYCNFCNKEVKHISSHYKNCKKYIEWKKITLTKVFYLMNMLLMKSLQLKLQ
jgi:hypothetical protein